MPGDTYFEAEREAKYKVSECTDVSTQRTQREHVRRARVTPRYNAPHRATPPL